MLLRVTDNIGQVIAFNVIQNDIVTPVFMKCIREMQANWDDATDSTHLLRA